MIPTGWIEALVDVDRALEFSGDVIDEYSKLVDLKGNYEFLTVKLPTITSSTISVYGQETEAVSEVPVPVHFWGDSDADTNVEQATVAATTALILTFRIGALQYIRIRANSTQAADISVKVRGFNRG
ncbi:hypothetical protein LCGC14_0715860 [marine sediment metagenome]|uniref:Uncharacterized protein n=1 Tax=marine sediment metagenome TaxID=412755 RepID=A0A0F9QYV9_9ZZZZ